MTVNTSISLIAAIVSWALAVFLVMTLLSGTFDTRSCQTTCVSYIFWSSFAIAIVGLLFSLGSISVGQGSVIKTLSMLALIGLCGIYITTMLIGTFGI